MSFRLETNVISEWTKPHPDPGVVAWLAGIDEERVFLSVASFAEIRHGIDVLPAGRRRDRLAAWLADDLSSRFEGRILDIDRRIADTWGAIMARGQKVGIAIGTMDAFFAATAEAHGLTLVSRDVQGFEQLGIRVLNPWLLTR